jgi:hypothetical protein
MESKNPDENRRTVEMIVATDHVVSSRYGELVLAEEALQDLARQINQDRVDSNVGHDPSRRLYAKDVKAWVGDHPDGGRAVFVRQTVDGAAWEAYEAEREAAGARGGVSIVFTEAVRSNPAASVAVIGDAEDFADSELVELSSELGDETEVDVARLYQLELDPDVIRFALDFAAGKALEVVLRQGARGLKRLWRRLQEKSEREGRPAVVDVRVRTDKGEAHTNERVNVDDDGLRRVLNALERIYEESAEESD